MKIYTLKDLVDKNILRIGERTIFKYLKQGILTGSKAKGQGKWLFMEEDIKTFLAKGRKKPTRKK